MERFDRRSDEWVLAYLRGRAGAFRRGKLSLANVAGAIRMARARQARDCDVRLTLAPFGLDWDGRELRDASVLGDTRPRTNATPVDMFDGT